MIVYISAGNSDNKLTQREWATLQARITMETRHMGKVHGVWYSSPISAYQNMCICAELSDATAEMLKATLTQMAGQFKQHSIAWAEVPATEFLGP